MVVFGEFLKLCFVTVEKFLLLLPEQDDRRRSRRKFDGDLLGVDGPEKPSPLPALVKLYALDFVGGNVDVFPLVTHKDGDDYLGLVADQVVFCHIITPKYHLCQDVPYRQQDV